MAGAEANEPRLDLPIRIGAPATLRAAMADAAKLAAAVCGSPMGAVKLLDDGDVWLEAHVGYEPTDRAAELALCSQALAEDGIVVLSDASVDERTAANPLVAAPGGLRFWAGVAVRGIDGHPLAILCVGDTAAHGLDRGARDALVALARQVGSTLALRRALAEITIRSAENEVLTATSERIHNQLDVAFRHAPLAMTLSDTRGRFLDVNAAFAALIGRTADELRGAPVLTVCAPAYVEQERQIATGLIQGERDSVSRIGELVRADGRTRVVRATTSIVRGASGEPQLFLTQAEDLSSRALAEAALGVATRTIDAIAAVNSSGRLVFWNSGAERAFGHTAAEVIGSAAASLIADRNHASFEAELDHLLETGSSPLLDQVSDLLVRHSDGHNVPVELSVTKEVVGNEVVYVGVLRDVTQRLALQRRLQADATFDRLTGVLTADAFTDAVAERGDDEEVAIVRIDLTNFHLINGSLGHGIGDEVLCAVARRLTDTAGNTGLVGRFGGDEFAVALAPFDSDVARVAHDLLRDAIDTPLPVYGRSLHLTVAAGVAVRRPGEAVLTVLHEADSAMHRAKRLGRGRIEVFDASMHDRAMAQLELEVDLRRALKENELTLHYQPEIDLRTGRVWYVEALIRWQHPSRGMVAPGEFIPAAEDAGLMAEIDGFALREATAQQARWEDQGLHVGVAVNTSVSELGASGLVERVRAATRDRHLPLSLEVTETVLMQDIGLTANALGELAGLGLAIAIDDFGTGYSSLAYLKRLPVDIVKIDRALLAGVETGDDAILRAVVSMARALSLQTVAEGVETADQLEAVRSLGFDFAQGFHLARPMPADAVSGMLER